VGRAERPAGRSDAQPAGSGSAGPREAAERLQEQVGELIIVQDRDRLAADLQFVAGYYLLVNARGTRAVTIRRHLN